MKNPFSLAFGKEPQEYISRTVQVQKIKDTFLYGDSGSQAYIITGIRGCGKTVLLTEIARQFDALDDWEAIDLNPNREMLSSLISKMNSRNTLARIFSEIRLSINLPGLTLNYGGSSITDPEAALEEMLSAMKKKNKKLLVTIDEVDKNENLKAFVSTFQMMIRKDLPVYLLMTGLYENVSSLQNESNLTFLLRTPKAELASLNRTGIISAYMRSCDVTEGKARQMAELTKGYAFAFQLLGYLFWNEKYKTGSEDLSALLPEYDQQLEEFVYAKIWSSLSPNDQMIMKQVSQKGRCRTADLLRDLGISNSLYSVYRKRLAAKGLINISERGFVSASLPRFDVFIRNYTLTD